MPPLKFLLVSSISVIISRQSEVSTIDDILLPTGETTCIMSCD